MRFLRPGVRGGCAEIPGRSGDATKGAAVGRRRPDPAFAIL